MDIGAKPCTEQALPGLIDICLMRFLSGFPSFVRFMRIVD
jgi:hypothetical protein